MLPERIREAREARGLTMEEFAERLNVSKQAVGQYEAGQTTPGAQAMSRIIAVTEQPPSFFTAARTRAVEGFGAPFWRGLKRMNRPDRLRIARRLEWAWDVVHFVERFIDLPPVNLPAIDWDSEGATDDDLEAAAERVRDHWGLGRGPVFYISPLLEANGVLIVKEPVGCEDMDAVSRWQGGRPFILCSADKDALPRKNFDLAHELAHLVLHYGVEVNPENLDVLERQANYFAGAFLLPRETFSREVISSSLDYYLNLKPRWRVSAQAMIYRAKNLGLLTKSQAAYLWRQVAARGMRRQETFDDAFEPESPTLLAAALSMLVEHGVRTRAQIRDALNLNPADLESICGVAPGFLGETVVSLKLRSHSERASNENA
jgi:Zn-dependent peptidase ImmA (M78 family)/transcriptional regulator with XRE-family HTH domain